MKAVVAAFNQEKALVGAFSVITNLRMELFGALIRTQVPEDEAGEVEEYAGRVEGEHLGGVLQAHLHHRLHHHHPHHQPVQGLA